MLSEFDAVQNCLRHIHKGQERISRQKALIREMREDGRSTLEAERILSRMEELQREFQKHLAECQKPARERHARAMALPNTESLWPLPCSTRSVMR